MGRGTILRMVEGATAQPALTRRPSTGFAGPPPHWDGGGKPRAWPDRRLGGAPLASGDGKPPCAGAAVGRRAADRRAAVRCGADAEPGAARLPFAGRAVGAVDGDRLRDRRAGRAGLALSAAARGAGALGAAVAAGELGAGGGDRADLPVAGGRLAGRRAAGPGAAAGFERQSGAGGAGRPGGVRGAAGPGAGSGGSSRRSRPGFGGGCRGAWPTCWARASGCCWSGWCSRAW